MQLLWTWKHFSQKILHLYYSKPLANNVNPLNPRFKVISILYLLFMNRSLKQGGSDSFLQTLLWPLTLSPTCHFLCLLTRGLVRSWPERLIKLTSRHPNVNPPSGLIVLWHIVTQWQYLKMLVQWCRGDRCTIRESTPGETTCMKTNLPEKQCTFSASRYIQGRGGNESGSE